MCILVSSSNLLVFLILEVYELNFENILVINKFVFEYYMKYILMI